MSGDWLVPFKSEKGDVLNLLLYNLGTNQKFFLPGLPLPLFGVDTLSPDAGRTVFLCEGPFDAIALDYHLVAKRTRQRYDILAVPSASVFKD
jgi:hypothetical protein